MPAPREILDLVAHFEQQFDAYQSGQYNETPDRRHQLFVRSSPSCCIGHELPRRRGVAAD